MHRLACGTTGVFYWDIFNSESQAKCPNHNFSFVAVFVIREVDGLDCFSRPAFDPSCDIGDVFSAEQPDISTKSAVPIIPEKGRLVG